MQTKNLSMSPEFSGFLDFVRWVAALLVVMHHGRHLWFADLSDVTNKTLLIKAFYFITGFGGEAVMVFFLLSGFLVGGGAIRKWRTGAYSSIDYMINRFSRIYTLLVPALIFGGLLDLIGLHYFNSTEIYTNSPRYHTKSLGYVISDNFNIPTFFSNLFNFQGILSSHFGSNSPLWSLSYEWWYYCLFALLLELMIRKSSDIFFWISGICIIATLVLFPVKLPLYFLIWALGAWIASIDHNRFSLSPIYGWAVFALLTTASRVSHIYFDSYENTSAGF